MRELIQIHPADNVAVALRSLAPGERVSCGGRKLSLNEPVPAGHKLALEEISEGETVRKYGMPIGFARRRICAGEWVHTHNLRSGLEGVEDFSYRPSFQELSPAEPAFFQGYARPEGRAGVRNEVWILPTVGCVNGVAKRLEQLAAAEAPAGVEGVFAFQHSFGCSQLGEDLGMTRRLLCGLAQNPNAGGVLVLGLGCENNRMQDMRQELAGADPRRVKFLSCQECEDEISAGMALLRELMAFAAGAVRQPCPLSQLTVGLKCGGSDGFSGITANPLAGAFSDWLLSRSGSALLTEVPEMFGAEPLLLRRCRSEGVYRRAVDLLQGFRGYFLRHGQRVDENPSPGNREGGVTTLAEKSLGCVQKSGSAPVEDVLLYGETVRCRGLSLLQAPGNDLTSACALAAAGAQLILFTTGRGTPFGCPVPTIKIASNSLLAEKKKNWIDFDAGRLLDGVSQKTLLQELAQLVLAAASGTVRAKSEQLDKSALSIWKDGVTL